MKTGLLVNLYGGPGSGKSTGAAYIFSRLKLEGYKVELITEFHKDFVYVIDPQYLNWDEIKRVHQDKIKRALVGTDIVITDCPVEMFSAYNPLTDSTVITNKKLDIFIRRIKKYSKSGRWQDEVAAKATDQLVHNTYKRFSLETNREFNGDEEGYKEIIKMIIEVVENVE